MRSARRQRLTALADDVSEAPLLSPLPRPGRIISEREIPEIGTTEVTVSHSRRSTFGCLLTAHRVSTSA